MNEQISYEQSEERTKRPITIDYHMAGNQYGLNLVRNGEMPPKKRYFDTYQAMVQEVEKANPECKVISI